MTRRRQPAAVLVLVLWAIAVLALLAGGLAFAVRQDLAISMIEQDRTTAHCLARAGVERAIAALTDDINANDAPDDDWYDNPTELQDISLVGGTFSVVHDAYDDPSIVLYGAADESAKLNLNIATRDQLMELPEMTRMIAGAIIDWRDSNEESEPDGAERGHYASLTHPYDIPNAPFRTVRELLLVRGVTPELFYGEDWDCDGRLDPNENDGDASDPPDNADGLLDRGWFAYLTVYSYERNVDELGQKRLNVNKADAASLQTTLGLEDWAAASIVKHREKNEFKHLVDLLDVERASDVSSGTETRQELNARGDNEKDKPVTQSIFQRIVDQITLTDDEVLPGRINVNMAPLEVLQTLPGVKDDVPHAIIRHREDGGGFQSIGELLDISGITKEKFAEIEDKVTVRSCVFRIQSHGTAASGLSRATIECVVDRGNDVPRVLYWLESSP